MCLYLTVHTSFVDCRILLAIRIDRARALTHIAFTNEMLWYFHASSQVVLDKIANENLTKKKKK